MVAGAGEVVAAAAGVGATGDAAAGGAAAEVEGSVADQAVMGPPTAGAPGLELTAGGGEVRRTRGRKE